MQPVTCQNWSSIEEKEGNVTKNEKGTIHVAAVFRKEIERLFISMVLFVYDTEKL